MKPKKKLFWSIVIVLIIVNTYCYIVPIFKSSNRNLENVRFDIALNSDKLVNNYMNDEDKANKLYTGKIIEVEGKVKEVSFLNNRNTVILYTKNNKSGVICDIHKSQIKKIEQIKKHQKIRIKGICKGFLKDVILLNCYIDLNLNE